MTTRREAIVLLAAAAGPAPWRPEPWGDSSRLGRPFSKDPSVIRFGGRCLLYYSMPGGAGSEGWAIGIAESRDLAGWQKTGEIASERDYERKGICAPFAKLIAGEIHLFYQTYGNREKDAICHAVSKDGLRFERDPTNPVFRPTGNWNAGRAIDGEVVEFGGRWLLYAATRDPAMKVQMIVGAAAERGAGFGRDAWRMLADGPLLRPELPWERDCVEAPALVVRGGWLYMFYAGAYNNAPQQIGCARSRDGVRWERLSREPLLPAGPPGSWNSSESGHPGVFTDEDGATYLFYQGNDDRGRTWLVSCVRIGWNPGGPYVIRT
jgi:beta-1,2-mannobiose phosphorylase / 1,2-beta-oligomannan phosphorylase